MTHYTTLGIPQGANQEEIKKAYRKLASQHHPDKGGDTKKFQEIQLAYDTLSNLQKKAEYDNPQPQMGGFHFHSGFPPGFENMFSQMGDPFGGMFRNQVQRNKSLNIQTNITLEDAFFGKELLVNINLPSGKEQLVEIKIPPGIFDGATLKFHSMGDNSISNIPRGDLHLTVHIQPHAVFHRQGDDLVMAVPINCISAMLGDTVTITTIDKKKLDISIAEGTQVGQILSVNGHGMPNVNNPNIKGRLLVRIDITIPTSLTDHQKIIITEHLKNV